MTADPPYREPSVRVSLLFLVAVISYVDRGSVSIAAPLLVRELRLSPVELGIVLSSFFWSYAALQTLGGWLVDRFSVKLVLGAGVALWSLATLGAGLANSMASLIVLRCVLGAGESVMFPSFSKAIATTFRPAARGLPNAIIDAGTKIGPALAVLLGGLLMAHFGWRYLFFTLGACSLLWIIPWFLWGTYPRTGTVAPRSAAASIPVGPAAPTLWVMLGTRAVWGTLIGAGSYTYAYFFLLTWLPTYLVQERHMSLETMAVLGSAPYWASAAAALAAGWGSDRLIQRGWSATVVRKSALISGLLLSIIALPSAFVADVTLSIWLLGIAYVAFGIFASNLWAVSQTLAGPLAAGKWAGLQNCFGASMGIAAPLVTGLIVQATGSFQMAFVVTAVLAVAGAASYLFLVGAVAPIDWNTEKGASQSFQSSPKLQPK